MPLLKLPSEIILIIFECLRSVTANERNPLPKKTETQRTVRRIFRRTKTSPNEKPPLSGEAFRTFKNMRLTSKTMRSLAGIELFRCISLSDKLQSWINVENLAAHPELAWNVEVLTLSIPQLCYISCKYANPIGPKIRGRSPPHYPARIDLQLFPFLKSIQCQKWKLVRIGAMKLPAEEFVIKPSLRMRNRGYLWNIASALSHITAFGWEFEYLHLSLLDQTKAWQKCIRTLRIDRLQTLDVDFRTHFKGWIGAHILETILPLIQDLPNLRTFRLKQFYNGEDPNVHEDLAANVFEVLENHNWPEIRKLEVSRPRTREKDFMNFLLKHKNTLQHLHYSMPGPNESLSEWMEEDDLEQWIQRNISPTEPWDRS